MFFFPHRVENLRICYQKKRHAFCHLTESVHRLLGSLGQNMFFNTQHCVLGGVRETTIHMHCPDWLVVVTGTHLSFP